MTLAICVAVGVGCLFFAWRLGQFLKRIDERHELVIIDLRKASVIAEAERITRETVRE